MYRGRLYGTAVAVKVIDVDVAAELAGAASDGDSPGEAAPSRALVEAALSRHLAHPSIVATLDYHVVAESQQVWIVQHLCTRGSLYNAVDQGWLRQARTLASPASMPAVVATAREIAAALEYLHSQDIIHGDLSGNNVLLSGADNARGFVALVNDFGLARALRQDDVRSTRTVGTVSHM